MMTPEIKTHNTKFAIKVINPSAGIYVENISGIGIAHAVVAVILMYTSVRNCLISSPTVLFKIIRRANKHI